MCVCVCVRVRACVRACVVRPCVCVRARSGVPTLSCHNLTTQVLVIESRHLAIVPHSNAVTYGHIELTV